MKRFAILGGILLLWATAPKQALGVVALPWEVATPQRGAALAEGGASGASFSEGDIVLTGLLPGVSGEEVVFVQVSLQGELPVGTEVEAWPLASDGSVVETFGRNLWVIDQRTGNQVSFDITRIARAWEEGSLANAGLLIHVVSSDEPQGAAGAVVQSASVLSGPVLTAHFIPIAASPTATSTGRPRRSEGIEQQGGRKDKP